MITFNTWFAYTKINNQENIANKLDNYIPSSQISPSLINFWTSYYEALPLPLKKQHKTNYNNYLETKNKK
jgi:hypothetical protein